MLEALPYLRERFDVQVAVLTLPGSERGWMSGVELADARQLIAGDHPLVHTHLFLPGLAARIRRLFGARFRWVHSVHYISGTTGASAPLQRWLDRWIFAATDILVAVSPPVYDLVSDLPQARLIPNALELGALEAAPPESLPPLIGSVSMLRREKGIEDLVRAIALLKERGVGAQLVIAGDGPLRHRLDSIVIELGVADRVELVGYVDDLSGFYQRLAVYVQPSLSESFGLAVLDALRYRRPVVATEVGFLPELLGQGEFGLLVPRSDDVVVKLADGIQHALDNRREMSAKAEEGRAHWSPRLDPGARAKAIEDAYSDALSPRVCYVAPVLSHGGGGLQRQVELQSRALSESGHRTMILQRRDPLLATDASHRKRWRHVEILSTPDFPPSGWHGGFWERIRGISFVVWATLRLLVHRAHYDVIMAQQLYSPTLAGAIAKRLTGKPLIVRVTASGELGELRETKRLPFRGLRRWSFAQVDRVVVLTEAMRREMLALGFEPHRIVRVPNAVELPEPLEREGPAKEQPFRLLYAGRLSSEKSLETAIDAAALLAGTGHGIELRLVGRSDGPRDVTDMLRSRARQLPDAATVAFPGPTGRLADEYTAADAFVLPSVSEGMSNSLLEAMSFGLPCLVSDIPENRAVLGDEKAGLFFRQGDPESLAEALRRLIDDAESGGTLWTRLSAGARARAESTFAVDAVARMVRRLLTEVWEENPHGID